MVPIFPGEVPVGNQLDPYIKSTKEGTVPSGIWRCPSDADASTGQVSSNGVPGGRWSSYHYRFYFYYCSLPVTTTGLPSTWVGEIPSEAGFPQPAQVYVFHELSIFHSNSDYNAQGEWNPDAHMNFLFLDGHTKAQTVNSTIIAAPLFHRGIDYHWPHWFG